MYFTPVTENKVAKVLDSILSKYYILLHIIAVCIGIFCPVVHVVLCHFVRYASAEKGLVACCPVL